VKEAHPVPGSVIEEGRLWRWVAVETGHPVPDDAISTGTTRADGAVWLARYNGATGKINAKNGKMHLFRAYGELLKGHKHAEVLCTTHKVEWLPIQRGQAFHDKAVRTGENAKDGVTYAGRHNTEPGKITTENGHIGYFCGHSSGSTKIAEILTIELVPCTFRMAVAGDKVIRLDGKPETLTDDNGNRGAWELKAGEAAVVVSVDGDGDFQLYNSRKVVSEVTYRKYYVFLGKRDENFKPPAPRSQISAQTAESPKTASLSLSFGMDKFKKMVSGEVKEDEQAAPPPPPTATQPLPKAQGRQDGSGLRKSQESVSESGDNQSEKLRAGDADQAIAQEEEGWLSRFFASAGLLCCRSKPSAPTPIRRGLKLETAA